METYFTYYSILINKVDTKYIEKIRAVTSAEKRHRVLALSQPARIRVKLWKKNVFYSTRSYRTWSNLYVFKQK